MVKHMLLSIFRHRSSAQVAPQQSPILSTDTYDSTFPVIEVKHLYPPIWDGQGTSYTPAQDKMHGLGSISETKEGMEGQGLAPAVAGPIIKISP